MKKMKKIIIGVGLLAAAGAGVFAYQKVHAKASDTAAVEMYQVNKQTPLHLKGQVQPTKKQTVLIDSEKGPVQTIHVNEGDHVAKNTVLVTYRWGEVIRAAEDSVVTALNVDAENDPQKALMVLKSEESVIKGTVTEYDRSKVVLNEPVEIQYVTDDKKVNGKITSIAEMNNDPDIETEKSTKDSLVTYNFTAIPDEAIPMGYSVELLIPRNEIHLPTQSVVEKDGKQYVYTISKKKAHKQQVNAEKDSGYYILHEGLNERDKIVKDAKAVKDGMDVTVE